MPRADELLRLIIESAVDYAIFSTDRGGLVTSWNTGAERVLGYAEAEILGMTADVIFTPEQRAAGVPDEERRLASLEGRAEDDRWQLRKGDVRFWATGLMMPLADRAQGFVKILRDRTEAHETERRRHVEQERFRLLATNVPQFVFRGRRDGRRTWASPQWIDFTGLDAAGSLGMGWLGAVHPADRQRTRDAWRAATPDAGCYVEHRVRRARDGAYRWHQTRARPIEGRDGEASDEWVGTMTDVHEMRGLQERQQILMAELQHRTRNLLAVTHAIAVQTLRKSASLEAFAGEFEGRLRALGRVQGLMARPEASTVDLGELIEAELRAHAATGSAAAGKVRVDGGPMPLPPTAAQVLGLAVHELATNAVKYGALGQAGGRLTISWKRVGAGAGRRISLEWRETGVALEPGPRPRGYGSELIEGALPYQLGAETRLEFTPHGVRCTIGIAIPDKESGVGP
ncbi:MAG: PAS domain S-box protein [Reyranellaceae bacterium]